MNIVCVICSELFKSDDFIYHTPCGHIFHKVCIQQWLNRSKTCPQCRMTTASGICRLYFSTANDSVSLEENTNNLSSQLELKQIRINNLLRENNKLKKQAAKLKQEVQQVKHKIVSKDNAISVLNDQIKIIKRECSDVKICYEKNKQLIQESECSKRDLRAISRRYAEKADLERIKRIKLEEQLLCCENQKKSLEAELFNVRKNRYVSFFINIPHNTSMENSEGLKAQRKYNAVKESNTVNIFIPKLDNTSVLFVKIGNDDNCIIIDNNAKITPQNIKLQGFFSKEHFLDMKLPAVPAPIISISKILRIFSILVKISRFSLESLRSLAYRILCYGFRELLFYTILLLKKTMEYMDLHCTNNTEKVFF